MMMAVCMQSLGSRAPLSSSLLPPTSRSSPLKPFSLILTPEDPNKLCKCNSLSYFTSSSSSSPSLHHRFTPVHAIDSDVPLPIHKGMLTGLLGNLSLLSYFAKKREAEVVVVQTLGVVSIYVVIAQLAMAEAMPLPHFVATSVVVASGLVLNFMYYFGLLNAGVWCFWEDFITVGGLSVLPQVMWSTFVPYIPNSILPGAIAFVVAVVAVVMARVGKLSEKGVKFVGAASGWTATLLFMWMPIAQVWTNILKPDNIKGLSAVSMLLAMIGNGLMIPRALFIRDLMWFTGSTWASVFYGWGNLVCLYCFKSISKEFFLAATTGLYLWLGLALWRDTQVYGYNSPLRSLKELFFGP